MIAGFADRLWKDLVGSGNKPDGSLPYSVTSIALGFSGVEPGEAGQQSIEGFFRPETSTKPPSSSDGRDGDTPRTHRGKRLREVDDEVEGGPFLDGLGIDREDTVSFVCPRCQKRIEAELGDGGELERAKALDRLRLEHGDFHIAEDLSKLPDEGVAPGPSGLRATNRERKRKKESGAGKKPPEEGIAKFLIRRPG